MADTHAPHSKGPLPRWFTDLRGGERALLILTVFGFGFTLADPAVHELARKLDPHTHALFQTVTDIGKSGWILWPTGLAVIVLMVLRAPDMARRARVAYSYCIGVFGFIFLAVAGSGLLAQLFKGIIGRPRPKLYETLGPLGFEPFAFNSSFASFPSGHATTIFALAMALALMVPRLRVLAFTVAVWVAASRFFVGAHYLTDVIAGAVLGAGFTLWLARAFAARRAVFEMRDGTLRMRGHRLTRWLWTSALGTASARLAGRWPARPVEEASPVQEPYSVEEPPPAEEPSPAEAPYGTADRPQAGGPSLARRLTGYGRGWRLWSRP